MGSSALRFVAEYYFPLFFEGKEVESRPNTELNLIFYVNFAEIN